MKRIITILALISCCIIMPAQQRFIYLTTDEVSIDSVLPHVGYHIPFPVNYNDSVYHVSLLYPEYIAMAPSEIEKYHKLSSESLPELPQPVYSIVFERKKPIHTLGVTPQANNQGK